MKQKKNITLIVGLSIPVLMIGFIAVSIYLPSFFVHPPQTNFIYSMGGDYYNRYRYTVHEGKVIENEIKLPENNNAQRYVNEPKLFYYDVIKDSTREISLGEAQGLVLNNQNISPDGFQVVSGNSEGDFFFFYDSYNGSNKYLKKGAFSRKLNLTSVKDYCYSFEFLGWIKSQQ